MSEMTEADWLRKLWRERSIDKKTLAELRMWMYNREDARDYTIYHCRAVTHVINDGTPYYGFVKPFGFNGGGFMRGTCRTEEDANAELANAIFEFMLNNDP